MGGRGSSSATTSKTVDAMRARVRGFMDSHGGALPTQITFNGDMKAIGNFLIAVASEYQESEEQIDYRLGYYPNTVPHVWHGLAERYTDANGNSWFRERYRYGDNESTIRWPDWEQNGFDRREYQLMQRGARLMLMDKLWRRGTNL